MAQHAVVALTEIAASPGATLDAASLSRALGKALKTPFEKQQEKKKVTIHKPMSKQTWRKTSKEDADSSLSWT